MFKWISNLFKPTPDKIEERLLSLFNFLLNTYGFSYSKEELGNAVDKSGKFEFVYMIEEDMNERDSEIAKFIKDKSQTHNVANIITGTSRIILFFIKLL